MIRLSPALVLLAILGCDPPAAPPAAPAPKARAKVPEAPIPVNTRDIGPQVEEKRAVFTGTRTAVGTTNGRKWFGDDSRQIITALDLDGVPFAMISADRETWGGYLLRSPRGNAITAIGPVRAIGGKWMLMADDIG